MLATRHQHTDPVASHRCVASRQIHSAKEKRHSTRTTRGIAHVCVWHSYLSPSSSCSSMRFDSIRFVSFRFVLDWSLFAFCFGISIRYKFPYSEQFRPTKIPNHTQDIKQHTSYLCVCARVCSPSRCFPFPCDCGWSADSQTVASTLHWADKGALSYRAGDHSSF